MTTCPFCEATASEAIARIERALRKEAAHLRKMIEAKESHVPSCTSRAWSYEATECEQLAGLIGKRAETTTFRPARGGRA